ncbi:MAG: hypothetical protein ACOCUT_02760 [bacterium]
MDSLCIKCKGKGLCGKPCKIISRFKEKAPKVKTHFSGVSPPEIFVGRNNYPNVFSGILAPATSVTQEDSINLESPEKWYKQGLNIEQILDLRSQLVYGRSITNIKLNNKIKQTTQLLAMASKPTSTEFFLKKKPTFNFTSSKVFSIMTNPAPLQKVNLEENPKIDKKVDYLVSDYDVKSTTALKELYKSKTSVTTLQKILSAGLLGVKSNRRMVPTRWSITAVDDTLSKNMLQKIRHYPEINQIQLFHNKYNGNYYEILLLPDSWSFEVIEAWMSGNVYSSGQVQFSQDYEGFFPRKTYASSVTGAYYANRLAVCEYLDKIKRQASILVLRTITEEYYAPLGVGILREASRHAFNKKPDRPSSINEAFQLMNRRAKFNVDIFKQKSNIIKEYGKQKKLNQFF